MKATTAINKRVFIRFVLHQSTANSNDGTLYIRVTVDGIRAPEKSTGIKIQTSTWDSKNQIIIGRSNNVQLLNEQLSRLSTDLHATAYLLERNSELVTAKKILDTAFRKDTEIKTFEEGYAHWLKTKETSSYNLSARTVQTYNRYYSNMKQYFSLIGQKNILLDDVSTELFLNMLTHFKSRYKNDYAIKQVQLFRSVINHCVDQGFTTNNPTKSVRLEKSGEYDTTHLTQDEVLQMYLYDFNKLNVDESYKRVLEEERDAFVFCCYTGLHHADYKKGMYEVIVFKGKKWLRGYRVKSVGGRKNKLYELPLHPISLSIIEKYGGVEKLPKRSNHKRNSKLKEIALYVGINVHLTTKIGRKTLANYCLNDLNMSEEMTAKVLGQTTTQFLKHYATITNATIANVMKF